MVVGNRRSPLEELYGYIIILGNSGTVPADAKSLARMHLSDISGRIAKVLDTKSGDSGRHHARAPDRMQAAHRQRHWIPPTPANEL